MKNINSNVKANVNNCYALQSWVDLRGFEFFSKL